mgnify:CR=1 FL=1
MPKTLLPGWTRAVAAWNPFTYMVDASRALTTGPLTVAPVAKAVAVAVGACDKDWLEVTGLPPGAKVITSGQSQLVDGSPIRVR